MKNKYCADLRELLQIFEENLSTADITSARLLSEISSVIVKSRIDMGMTQKEFAEHMNVSQSMVSKWESSDYNFSIKALAEVASKLDLEVNVRLYKSKVVEMQSGSNSNIKHFYSLPQENLLKIRNSKDNELSKMNTKIVQYIEKKEEMKIHVDSEEYKKCYSM